jgi:hypothetical protein
LDGSNTLSAGLLSVNSLEVRKTSLVFAGDAEFGMTREERPRLAILAQRGSRSLASFEGEASAHGSGTLMLCPRSAYNAAALRESFAWLEPRTMGMETSAGLGDRLGLATPGHVRAVRAAGGNLAPIFAQQSIREMERLRGPRPSTAGRWRTRRRCTVTWKGRWAIDPSRWRSRWTRPPRPPLTPSTSTSRTSSHAWASGG